MESKRLPSVKLPSRREPAVGERLTGSRHQSPVHKHRMREKNPHAIGRSLCSGLFGRDCPIPRYSHSIVLGGFELMS